MPPHSLATYSKHAVLSNASFLIANTFAGSLFGFLFWIVATHRYTPTEVGLGAAYISALTLLSAVTDLGLSTTLIRFGPTAGAERVQMINSVLTVVTIATLGASLTFALGTPLWSPGMAHLARSQLLLAVFVASALLFALAQILDKVFVAFETTHFMFLRNLLSNAVRLAIILLAAGIPGSLGLVLSVGGGSLAGVVLGLAILAPIAVADYRPRPACDWRMLHDKAIYSLGNHFTTLVWNVPTLVYPLIVVSLLGASLNAQFYISWMLANLLFIVPTSISTSAFARAANAGYLDEGLFWRTMWLTLAGLVLPAAALAFGAPVVLRLFGNHYGVQDPSVFILLVLSVFPYTVNTAVITFHRIERHIGRMLWVSGLATALSLGASVVLGAAYGLTGIGLGWLLGQLTGVGIATLSRATVERATVARVQELPGV